ncbi:hypothetical protein T492DRAFT_845080 [Pavlovales sp. CCMP2436]|nr:hypothetical protein T492DRAFT_845080 [Pavlovales sp. CCMP2436]
MGTRSRTVRLHAPLDGVPISRTSSLAPPSRRAGLPRSCRGRRAVLRPSTRRRRRLQARGNLLPRVGVDDHLVRRREVVLRQHVRAAVPAEPRVRGGAQLARVMDGVERVDGALERLVVRVERTRRAPEQDVQARLHLLQPVKHRYQPEVLRERLCVARPRFCLGDGPSGSEARSSRRTWVTNRVGTGDAVGEARRA